MSGGLFAGKVAFVTGAAQGIGLAAARRFAQEGAYVAMLDSRMEVRAAADLLCTELGTRALALVADLRDGEAVTHAVQAAMHAFGGIDVLANVAGIFPIARFEALDEATIDDILAVNLTGTMRTCRLVLPIMRDRGGGAIVNVASGAAFLPIEGLTAYGASKAAVVAFSRSLALEVAPRVRVNVVSPGTTLSPPVEASMNARGAQARARFLEGIPMGSLAVPADIAEAILFLASPRASHITGTTLPVNGGSLMR